MSAPTVVTLLPSATEITYALGVEPAAVSHECTYPPAAADRPRANTCRIDPDADSETINAQLDADEPVYEIDHATLERVDPDLIVTQGVCDVCAVDSVLVRDAVADRDLDCEILTTDPHSLDDVLGDVERIGAALGREDAAADLVTDLRRRIERIRDATADRDPRRCLVLDWMTPPMVAGHWVPEMAAIAGGEYGITDPGAYSGPEDFQDIVAFDPETLVVAPCGYSESHTRRDLDELRDREGWDEMTAVREGEVYVMDGDVVNCPSPRLVDALEDLAGILHPDAVAIEDERDAAVA